MKSFPIEGFPKRQKTEDKDFEQVAIQLEDRGR